MMTRAAVPSSSEVVEASGGALLAVGPVVTFFTWWSWWTVAGIALTLAGVLLLASTRAIRDGTGVPG